MTCVFSHIKNKFRVTMSEGKTKMVMQKTKIWP